MPNGFIVGDDARVIAWVHTVHKIYPAHVNRAFGIVRNDGMLVGAVLLQCFNGYDIQLSYYGQDTVKLGVVRCVARAIITEFNPSRVTIITSKRNKHLCSSVQKLGWRLEGAQRCYYGHKDCRRNTGVRFVMFREQVEVLARISANTQTQKQRQL